jgi:hypothetical protein
LKNAAASAKSFYDDQCGVVTAVAEENQPRSFSVSQNFPNPFNPTTVISYQLPVTSTVRLDIYDVLGRKVASLADGIKSPGKHQITWNASGVSSGVYIYRIEAAPLSQNGNLFSKAKKMILVK